MRGGRFPVEDYPATETLSNRFKMGDLRVDRRQAAGFYSSSISTIALPMASPTFM